MRRYTLVSGLFLTALTAAQLLRVVMRWPVRVASFDVPVWVSVLAAVIVGSLAIWAFRARAHPDHAPAV
jgi:hypothetical protein